MFVLGRIDWVGKGFQKHVRKRVLSRFLTEQETLEQIFRNIATQRPGHLLLSLIRWTRLEIDSLSFIADSLLVPGFKYEKMK